jgi:DnaK suppressor protein
MRKRELDKFRKLLEDERDNLVRKAARTRAERAAAVNEGGEDYVDDAVSSYTREFLLSLSDLDRRTLNLVMEALERIHDGTYGECVNCGEKISMKRLQAVPWARYDVHCQEAVERQEMADLPLRDFSKDIDDEETGGGARAAAGAEESTAEDVEGTADETPQADVGGDDTDDEGEDVEDDDDDR